MREMIATDRNIWTGLLRAGALVFLFLRELQGIPETIGHPKGKNTAGFSPRNISSSEFGTG